MNENLKSLSKEVEKLWKQHLEAKFPANFYENDSVDLVMLDADIAGCISTFVECENLNLFQTAILGLCFHQISLVIKNTSGENVKYLERLERLSELVLKAVVKKNYKEHLKN